MKKLDRRKPGFHLTLKPAVSRDRIAALSATQQADLAYDVLGGVADKLTESGIDPDLVATAAIDLGRKLERLDGSPPRVVRLSRSPRS
jgi:hypothetical protein